MPDTVEGLSEYRFCFGGEFGYELLAWIPWLDHVSKNLQSPIRTASRPGSRPLYGLSSDHIEVSFSWRPDSLGTRAANMYFFETFGPKIITPQHRQTVFPQIFDSWALERVPDIHQLIDTSAFCPIRSPNIGRGFIPHGVKIAVINNKDVDNWGNSEPALRESFSVTDLHRIRDALLSRGYFVVYNRNDEPVSESRFSLRDSGIFDGDGCLDMRHVYARTTDANERMKMQLQVYSASELAVCPQGGNAFLPMIYKVPTLLLVKQGKLVPYFNLHRIYGTLFQVFCEVSSLERAIQSGTMAD